MKEKSGGEVIDTRPNRPKWSAFEYLLLLGCVFSAVLMLIRTFFGIEITDEAYYISDALGMIHGNLPYALDNFSQATGCAFLAIPPLWLYEKIVPDREGVVLFIRLCYVVFHLVCIFICYLCLRPHVRRDSALLFCGCLIPFVVTGIFNYSYNTVPADLSVMTSLIVYHAVEGQPRRKKLLLFLAGFLIAIAVFANPGYAAGVILLSLLILIRSKKKLADLLWYFAGGITEIFVVFVPILLQSGFETLKNGIEPMFFSKFITGGVLSVSDNSVKFMTIWQPAKRILLIFAVMIVLTLGTYAVLAKKKGRPFDVGQALLSGLSLGICAYLAYLILRFPGKNAVLYLGVAAAVSLLVVLFSWQFKKLPLFVYVAVTPVVFTVLEVLIVGSGNAVIRFWASLPALFAVLLLLLEDKKGFSRVLVIGCAVVCILLQGYTDYRYIYRETGLKQLTCRVDEGVYKGLYTTPDKASDVIELERYLNTVVSGSDRYAYRDNSPCGYLMTHGGDMCDATAWDKMQYSYGRNYPSSLFDYYLRRDAIPDVIVYLDFGRDPNLSIEDESFRYNDFVHAYYTLTDDVRLNETFKHVMVYRYAGGFDGDYRYWIDTYNTIPD